MEISQYLIIKKNVRYSRGTGYYAARLTQKSPALASNEIAVKIRLQLPDAIFEKPAFEAKVVVPDSAISKPIIEADVIDNVEQIIKQNTGFEVKLTMVDTNEE